MQEDDATGERTRGGSGKEKRSLKELYDDAALFLFRYAGFTSFDQVDKVTLPEYRMLVKAEKLKQVDKDYRNHLQAYLNLRAQDKVKAGKGYKYRYSTFEKFYNAEKAEREAMRNKGEGKIRQALSKAIGDIYRKQRGQKNE